MMRDRAWVLLPSGRRLDLLEPSPEAWTDRDLALSLSRTYRWGGHSRWDLPLSVAQHSLLVLVLRQQLQPCTPLTRLEASRELLHDAEEGLLGFDAISPLKPHLGDEFRAITGRLRTVIDARYGLSAWDSESYRLHKKADRIAAASEALHVAGWWGEEIRDSLGITTAPVTADPLPRIDGLQAWEPWPSRLAAVLFLAKLQELLRPETEPRNHAVLDAVVNREHTIAGLAQSFSGLPPGCRRRLQRPLTGSSLTDTFVFAEAHDGSQHAEGVVVVGDRNETGAWDFDADFTLLTIEVSSSSATDGTAMSKSSNGNAGSSAALGALTDQQRAAATATGAVLVLAGAGTGKTKTLTAAVIHRIEAYGVPPARILAVTFTHKAAGEMSSRIRAELGEDAGPHWIGTFHGLAARQLRIEPEVAGLRPGFDILDADDSRRIVKRVMKAQNLIAGDEEITIGRDPLKAMCNRLSKFKDNLITPADAPAQVEAMIAEAHRIGTPIDPHGLRASARVYADYQRTLRDGNAADFGDLLLWPTLALQRNDDYRTRWSGRFDVLLADEYQDVNYAQYSWLRLLSAAHGQLFAVGDDDQAVYSFRGADIRYIRRFRQDFPRASQIRLEENFRSTGHILAAANAVIARDRNRLGKTLFTRKAEGDRVEVVAFRNAEAEALGIVTEIQRRHGEGLAWSDMAILYRSNALSREFEEALMRARVPHVLVGDVGFYERAEIKDVLALLRLCATPEDRQSDEAFRRVINVPARGFGAKALQEVETEAAWRQVPLLTALETANLPPRTRAAGLAFVDAIKGVARHREVTLADQISLVLDATGYRAMLRESRAETSEGRLENVQELIELAGGFHTARDLLDHAALSTSGPKDGEGDQVRLMTLHRAKGLEFPQVFLPAWEAGVFPPDYGELAEERRLAYVAITRGMRRVTITHSDFRRGYARPSCFVADLPGEHRTDGWLRDSRGLQAARRPSGPDMRLSPAALLRQF